MSFSLKTISKQVIYKFINWNPDFTSSSTHISAYLIYLYSTSFTSQILTGLKLKILTSDLPSKPSPAPPIPISCFHLSKWYLYPPIYLRQKPGNHPWHFLLPNPHIHSKIDRFSDILLKYFSPSPLPLSSTCKDSYLGVIRCSPGFRSFKSSPGDSNMQLRTHPLLYRSQTPTNLSKVISTTFSLVHLTPATLASLLVSCTCWAHIFLLAFALATPSAWSVLLHFLLLQILLKYYLCSDLMRHSLAILSKLAIPNSTQTLSISFSSFIFLLGIYHLLT